MRLTKYWSNHMYLQSLLNILQEIVNFFIFIFIFWAINLHFIYIYIPNCNRVQLLFKRSSHLIYHVNTKIKLETSSFMVLRTHEVRNPSLSIHNWYYKIGLSFSSSFLISSIGFSQLKKWQRTVTPWIKRMIWFSHNRKFVVLDSNKIKLG